MNYVYSDPNPIPLDRHHLHNVRRAFLHLNNARLELAKESLGEAQRLFLDILPALIHFNHPMLPGYVTRSTPSGVYGFSMANEEQMNQLRKLTRSFNPSTYRDNKQEQTDILALYSMGSMGTIAQNSKSDIDIWLCYRPNLSYREQELLSEKCKRICAWAKNLDIDATIFLMDHLNFCAQTQLSFSKEASGSTQHYLLLDEFYRTIIHLAGQLPIWLFVRPEQEHSYEAIAKAIQEQRLLPENQDVDFGNIDSIPASEFISSAIWQLYKAIESPYKSILKLLVLEIYCHQYPDLPLLSNHFKSHLHDVDKNKMVNLWDVDPYLLNYYFIEEYLLSTKQTPRLEFIRRCFYFKLDQPLTDNDKQSRKLSIIGEMARSWGWDNDFISHLDNHRSWSLKDTLDERRRIINELNNSYQQIMNFFRNQKGQIQVPNREMNILGRKLHAAFAKKTGKIDWVNPVISNNITEPEITIRKQANSDLWAAVDCNDKAIASKATPLELITWLHCNQVMIAATRLLFNNQQTDTRLYYSLRRFITSLIPLPLTIAKHNDFEKGCQLKKLLFFVDYRPDKFQLTDTITDRVNLLSLTCDIDVLTINSWNEIICTHKQGPLLESMIAIFIGIFKRETNHFNPDILFNYPERNIQQTIRSFFAPLFKRVIEFFKQCPRGRYITHINNRYLLIHLGDQGSDIQWLSTERELKKILLSPMPYYSPVYMDMETMAYHPLAIFIQKAQPEAIQVFFCPRGKEADVTLIDERGTWSESTIPYTKGVQSLEPLHCFLRAINGRRHEQPVEVGPLDILPITFYQLEHTSRGWQPYRCDVNSNPSESIELYAIAEYLDKQFQFIIRIEDQLFSEPDEGKAAYQRLAHWIIAQGREKIHHWHIYDLDLSPCRSQLSDTGELVTSHYLGLKQSLEKTIGHYLDKLQ